MSATVGIPIAIAIAQKGSQPRPCSDTRTEAIELSLRCRERALRYAAAIISSSRDTHAEWVRRFAGTVLLGNCCDGAVTKLTTWRKRAQGRELVQDRARRRPSPSTEAANMPAYGLLLGHVRPVEPQRGACGCHLPGDVSGTRAAHSARCHHPSLHMRHAVTPTAVI